MTADSRFGVLGPLVFERAGRVVPVPSGHQRTLLAVLLAADGAPLTRDRLIDELWGERPPSSAVSALHVHLSKLRELLGDLLVRGSGGYALTADEYELDVHRFDALVAQARLEPAQATLLLREAHGLIRGEPLSDVPCEGTVADWRRALEERLLQLTLMRIDADLAAGADAELVTELERLVAAHPFEERLSAQLMLALYRSGRQSQALETYDRARRTLSSELGLEPGDQLTRLQARILEHDPALVLAQAPAVAAPQGEPLRKPARSNLPKPVTRMVGREDELTTLTGMMADPDMRLLTLTGPGGVGKTRLLLALAHRAEPTFRDGAVFVRLERLTDPGQVAAGIAGALAERNATDEPSADGLSVYLRDRELLIAIDNFEHLLPASVVVAELLEQAPMVRVLVSSRSGLRIRGEQHYEVGPLPLPAGATEAEITRSPAVQLFLQSALAADRTLPIDADVHRTVAEICQELDGLPLAIELAASRCVLLSPAQIAEQLTQPLTIGEHGLRDLPGRQQTLRATMQWSHDLLSPGAQEALRSAGVFLGGFTPDAIAAVVGRPVQAELAELVEASLVRRHGDSRFALLELVRAFALEQLHLHGSTLAIDERYRRYFATVAGVGDEAFQNGVAPGIAALPLLPDQANLRAALEDAIEMRDKAAALAIAYGMRPIWFAGHMRLEAADFVERLLAAFTLTGDEELTLMRVAAFLEDYDVNSGWNRRVAERARELGDHQSYAIATFNIVSQAINRRDLTAVAEAIPLVTELIADGASVGTIGWGNYYLSLDAYIAGRFPEAFEYACVSVEKAREAPHEYMLAAAIGTRLLAKSARDGAIRQPDLAEVLEQVRRLGVQPMAVFALWLVARYAAGVADPSALRWLAHAERILASLDTDLWPENVLRDETMRLLGVADLTSLQRSVTPMGHGEAVAAAAAWLADRDDDESSPRTNVGAILPAVAR